MTQQDSVKLTEILLFIEHFKATMKLLARSNSSFKGLLFMVNQRMIFILSFI